MPTRYLKPGVRDSDAIDKLSALAETLFYRLLVTVDDFGRFDARPAMVKAQCFPIKESVTIAKCRDLLAELCTAGLLIVYAAEGKECLQMLKWDNAPRSKESKFPQPPDECIQVCADANIPRTSLPVTETGTETNNRNGNGNKKPGADALPPDGVSQSVWDDFVKLRKAKRAPITDTAIDGIDREASKAGISLEAALRVCCERGWQSFKAHWDWGQAAAGGSPPPNRQEALEASNRAVVARLLEKEAQNAGR